MRIATASDIPALTRLINDAYRVELFFVHGERTSEPEVTALMNEPDCAFLVIDGDAPGTLVGSILCRRKGDRGFFGYLAVDPTIQRSGFGRRLVTGAEEHFRGLGCRHVDLDVVDVRRELPPFYHKLGYRETGTVMPFPKPELLKVPAQLVLMSKAL